MIKFAIQLTNQIIMKTNKTTIQIIEFPQNWDKGMTKNILPKHLRTANKVGDIETINNMQLSWLKEQGFKYQTIEN